MAKFNVGDEVYVIESGVFGELAEIDGMDYIVDYTSGTYCCIEEDLVPVDESKLAANDTHLLIYTMAGRIPGKLIVDGKPSLIVAVGSNERSVPHFHVFRNDQDLMRWDHAACIMYKENRYFVHNDRSNETLNKHEITALKMKLKQKREDTPSITYWDWIVRLWNDSNPNYKLPIDLKMPYYNYDTIKSYKEK